MPSLPPCSRRPGAQPGGPSCGCPSWPRVGDPYLAEFAVAVLACGPDLDAEDDESGGVPAQTTRVLDGFVLLNDALAVHEVLALAAVGAIAVAMPRSVAGGCPVTQLPRFADRLDQAVAAGRAAT
ncbi:hypothetical protein [Kitasatospora sp. NPDC097643]|uniref:hypothetical protein n=1 Tax=Kitasatospora sp. NPDC097643 TaxID=3157230 RepID=UPI003319C632